MAHGDDHYAHGGGDDVMTLHTFAERHRLRIRRAEDGTGIIPGRLGHLYTEDGERGVFGLALLAPSDDVSLDNTLRARARKAIRAGFEPHQIGDFEAILFFDATESKQARLAVKLAEARKARRPGKPTAAQVRARALFSALARSKRPRQRLETAISFAPVVRAGEPIRAITTLDFGIGTNDRTEC
jgi:hypothetical protein